MTSGRHELVASPMTSTAKIRAVVILSGLLYALAVPPSADLDPLHTASKPGASPVDVWSGWRGLTSQGRTNRPLPTRWRADAGIRWKTPLPGRGHSSPIVFGDSVY